jgi:hypothetical protein
MHDGLLTSEQHPRSASESLPAKTSYPGRRKLMADEGTEHEAASAPRLAAVLAARREAAENASGRRRGRSGASILVGLAAILIAALSAVALWLSA